ncbi:MAG: glutamyl-tRNA reductase [Mucilaginibacter sp.]
MAANTTFINSTIPCNINSFFAVGINYKKTDASVRGMFAIGNEQYESILTIAPSFGVTSLFILSTCNRTEIYGFAETAEQLINLLCTQTKGSTAEFARMAYIKAGKNAIEHLFHVGAGLDSQLLGDYEIVGQLKQAVKFAKEQKFINSFLERLFNDVLQASKKIKNETTLSDGTVSVSFAASQYIKSHTTAIVSKNILVLGAGKIGRNTCKNLVDYLGTHKITVINRTEEKAARLASELNINYASIDELDSYVSSADIIITATNAEQPIILSKQLGGGGNKLIIDLAIPHNVEESVSNLSSLRVVNVDELSKINDLTLQRRKMESPKAIAIINDYIDDFIKWHRMRKNAPILNSIKLKLNEIALLNTVGRATTDDPSNVLRANKQLIQTIINGVAGKMHNRNEGGCHYIQAINEFIGMVC